MRLRVKEKHIADALNAKRNDLFGLWAIVVNVEKVLLTRSTKYNPVFKQINTGIFYNFMKYADDFF